MYQREEEEGELFSTIIKYIHKTRAERDSMGEGQRQNHNHTHKKSKIRIGVVDRELGYSLMAFGELGSKGKELI